MSLHRAKSASALRSNAPAATSASSSSKPAPRSRDPTLARSFRGHHGAVLSCAYSPVLTRAIDTNLPGYARTGTDQQDASATAWLGGTASSRARAQKAATSLVQQLASGGTDHVVMVWHLRPQLRAFRFLGHSGSVNSVGFSSDGTLLASGSDDATVRVWVPTQDGKSTVLRGHMQRVRCISWGADKRWLLSASDDQQVKLWDVEKGHAHSHFHGHTQAVTCCHFSPDMRLVSTGSSDQTVKIFDTQKQSCLQTFWQNQDEVTTVKFHPFGNVLATGAADNSIKLWDIRHKQLLQHYSAHDLSVTSIDFHPSGNYLLSTSLDSSIRLWDLRKGHQLYTIHGHPSPVNTCCFTADGESFVTGGDDQRVITWNTNLSTGTSAVMNTRSVASMPDLPSVGVTTEQQSASKQLLRTTGAMTRNSVQLGKRDAFYVAQGLESLSTASAASLPTPIPVQVQPEPSGPLPPTALNTSRLFRSQRSSMASLHDGKSTGLSSPAPSYTFKTGKKAGQVIGPGSLYINDDTIEEAKKSHSHTSATGDSTAACDYTHTHMNTEHGSTHSFQGQMHPAIRGRVDAVRAQYNEEKEHTIPVPLDQQPFETQMAGFWVPGFHTPSETGIATKKSGELGPSPAESLRTRVRIPAGMSSAGSLSGVTEGGVEEKYHEEFSHQQHQQQQQGDPLSHRSNTSATSSSSSASSLHVPVSFAASAAGLQSHSVHPVVSRSNPATGAAGSAHPHSHSHSHAALNQDAYVYSTSSDRFHPSTNYSSSQAQTSEIVARKNAAGVDIFAIPPADHVQRLPEQLAHTLKYMVTQLEQITKALHVYEYRLNTYEQKVERLEVQQSRWNDEDGTNSRS